MPSSINNIEDPAIHFGLPQCRYCTTTPCSRLREGHIRDGEFIFVTRREIGWCECPFAAPSIDSVAQYLGGIRFFVVKEHFDGILYALTQSELLHYNQDHFLNSWDDAQGRVDYLLHLMQEDMIVALGVPTGFEHNDKVRKWFYAHSAVGITLPGEVLKPREEEGPAETDALAEQPQVTLSNPRWEHADADKRAASPTTAGIGDAIKLKADSSGLDDGATVLFRICDTSGQPPREIDVIDGSVQNRVGTADWTITLGSNTNTSSKPKLEFDARAQGRSTKSCTIKLSQKRSWLHSA
jgi:hypothetical protein